MKGFIGAANIDTNSRLCMSSAVTGYKRAFGADVVPCSYEDVESSDLVVLVGSNAARAHPVLYQRLVQAKRDNPQMKVVVIDPRRTATCDIADSHGGCARQRWRAVCRLTAGDCRGRRADGRFSRPVAGAGRRRSPIRRRWPNSAGWRWSRSPGSIAISSPRRER